MSDIRVPMDPLFEAFGVPATVTRPEPDDTPIATSVIWESWPTEDAAGGFAVQRREPRRVLAMRLDQVPTVPRGTVIQAPEQAGAAIKRWKVDGFDRLETEIGRYIVIPFPDELAIDPEI